VAELAVLAELLSVIGGEDDDRLIEFVSRSKRLEETSETEIHVLDLAEIAGVFVAESLWPRRFREMVVEALGRAIWMVGIDDQNEKKEGAGRCLEPGQGLIVERLDVGQWSPHEALDKRIPALVESVALPCIGIAHNCAGGIASLAERLREQYSVL
jgi:hypothetical protein